MRIFMNPILYRHSRDMFVVLALGAAPSGSSEVCTATSTGFQKFSEEINRIQLSGLALTQLQTVASAGFVEHYRPVWLRLAKRGHDG